MKPKNKYQKEIVELSKSVPKITNVQTRWAEEKCFDKYYVQSRKSNYCLECGNTWRSSDMTLERLLPLDCPECNAKELKVYSNWIRRAKHSAYWAVVITVEDFQVVRIIFSSKYMKKKLITEYEHHEVMQHWVDQNGKLTSLSMLAQGQGGYYDSWILHSKLEVRTNSRSHEHRVGIIPNEIYPEQGVLPIMNRNGFYGDYLDSAPHYVFSALLSYSKAETLLKSGQVLLFKTCLSSNIFKNGHIERIEKYWGSICIAIRNKYIIKSASDWFDYLGMLSHYDKDLLNAHYVCPKNLHKEHQRYVERMNRERKRKKIAELKKEADRQNKEYIKEKQRFFDLCFRGGDIEIQPLRSVHEFVYDAEELKHCIFSSEYYNKKGSLVLSARINGKPVENVEVDIINLKVVQSRGWNNKPSKHNKKIVEIVNSNMAEIGKLASKKYKQVG